MPDYYRGFAANTLQNPKEFLKNNSDWNGQLKEDFLKVKEYGKNLNPNCETFGSIGTCWGTYPVIRMSEDVEIKAGISMHPSHPPIIGKYTICVLAHKYIYIYYHIFQFHEKKILHRKYFRRKRRGDTKRGKKSSNVFASSK